MATGKDYSNQHFGCLLVIEPTELRGSNGSIVWKCLCQKCNSEVLVSSKNFTRSPKECSKCKTKSELGKKYFNLTVESYVESDKAGCHWLCKCICGNTTIVSTKDLRSGRIKSCGCLQRKKASEQCIDMTGKQFGRWKVISKSMTNSSRQVKWLCECSCEKHTRREVVGAELRRGTSLSCGCLRMSHGEYSIANLLQNANIPYEMEKKFDTCILSSGLKARFDFWVDNKYVIEFDGIQHFRSNDFFASSYSCAERDSYKNNWCKKNNIPIIRIPYHHLNDLELEDLKLETSKYLLNLEN